MTQDFWYVASSYSRHPLGIEEAFRIACANTGLLMKRGIRVFSPIAHTHPIAQHAGIPPKAGYDFWLPQDQPIAYHSRGLIVLKTEGWSDSHGVSVEIGWFNGWGKPIVYMEPGIVPAELTP